MAYLTIVQISQGAGEAAEITSQEGFLVVICQGFRKESTKVAYELVSCW